ncbi:REP-associated tyrosine transposase [Bergeriella denitrificans]|uniref:Putative type I restriction-modification system DNA methylase n=1 Tax=Bergeriella denitrificans TaxID=494 RepID=A0A378UEG7_BERDE|nr:transposase [Bergeriella denitrificans]STZ75705.1 putative type I restriction-modification system DNA methylase [Bergeriella denitrificans]
MDYRRFYRNGGLYFFTVNSYQRRPILTRADIRSTLREAVQKVRQNYPFEIQAWVLLPDHLHTIWQMPEADADFSVRWNQIKRHVTFHCGKQYADGHIWQNRFWEHHIRDEQDFANHFDYIHWNPMKHGYVRSIADWPYSTFHRHVKAGIYPPDWCGGNLNFTVAHD